MAIGLCGGVEQAGLGRSICLVTQASENVDSKLVESQLEGRAWEYTEGCGKLYCASQQSRENLTISSIARANAGIPRISDGGGLGALNT